RELDARERPRAPLERAGAAREDGIEERLLVRHEIEPLLARLQELEDVLLRRPEPEEARLLLLFDQDEAAHGEIDERRRHVAEIGRIIDERAELRRREPVRR